MRGFVICADAALIMFARLVGWTVTVLYVTFSSCPFPGMFCSES